MPEYRAYIVGHDGRFKTFQVIVADDDDNAVKIAEKFVVDGHSVEVWQLDRKIRHSVPQIIFGHVRTIRVARRLLQ